jgi:fatty-acid desaturase
LRTDEGKLKPVTTVFVVLFHLVALAALFVPSWPRLGLGILMYWVGGSLGIGIGFHRLLTHRGFRTSKPVEYFLTICGSLALQGGAGWWVAWHRIHHKYSEQKGDPHTPLDGKWWSHLGWLLWDDGVLTNQETLKTNSPELMRDPFHRLLNRWHWMPIALLGVALLALGGWPLVAWGIAVPVVLSWHATWLVNSATHLWGSRRFKTGDNSRNNWWVAILAFGEGWHNNHHGDPVSPRHGLAWYEFDLNWIIISVLSRLRVIRNVQPARKWRQLKEEIERSTDRVALAGD